MLARSFGIFANDSKETDGDLVEAILGAHYVLRVRRGWEFDFIVADFIVMLERLCICTYVQSVMP